jgi:N-carbamoylputrescine amidase
MNKQVPRPVTVGLIQQANLSSDLEKNKTELFQAVDRLAENADFVMPTELSTTPYFGSLHDRALETWAEELEGSFLLTIGEIAAHRKSTILVPIYLRRSGGSFANAVIVIGPDGRIVSGEVPGCKHVDYFSKVHLPSARRNDKGIDEPFYFQKGNSFPVFKTPKARIGVLICYDRRFPEAWRSLALSGAELIFMPSCVPSWNPSHLASTGDMFVAELRTRACENGVYVAACNRAGVQKFRGSDTHFIGKSCVIDPAGGMLAQASDTGASDLLVEIDLDKVRRVRHRLTLLGDRQPDAYGLERTLLSSESTQETST